MQQHLLYSPQWCFRKETITIVLIFPKELGFLRVTGLLRHQSPNAQSLGIVVSAISIAGTPKDETRSNGRVNILVRIFK